MDPIEWYRRFVDTMRAVSGVSPELLHVNCGLGLWLISAILLRKSTTSSIPVAIVLAAAVGNEVMDALYWGHFESTAAIDIFNSIAWPTIITSFQKVRLRTRI